MFLRFAACLFALLGTTSALAQTAAPTENKWEKTIAAFEAKDKTDPPAPGGVLFVGSSSIVRWKLADWFPNQPVINRGFGGSQIADSLHFAPRIVLPYKPKRIVFYAGDNDIASKKSPAQVADDFEKFVQIVHAALPETRIAFLAIKPSPARWSLIDRQREANAKIRAFIAQDPRLTFIDVEPPMLGKDGQPKAELFVADKLHLSDAGYELWTSLVKDFVSGTGK